MSRFKVYSPDQAYLLPPSVRDELGEKHLCFFVRGVIERLDMSEFKLSYSIEGGVDTSWTRHPVNRSLEAIRNPVA